jgi:hypothetical protein
MRLFLLDPGLRRDDKKELNQHILVNFLRPFGQINNNR